MKRLMTRAHISRIPETRQHTSAYVSIRQHTSAYVSIRQHTDTSAYVIDTSAYDLLLWKWREGKETKKKVSRQTSPKQSWRGSR
jgi:hypothetical protein